MYSLGMGYEWLIWSAGLAGLAHAEVIEALENPKRWPRASRTLDDLLVVQVWSRTDAGLPVIVALRLLGGFDQQILGARPMDENEIAVYEEWETER